MKKTASKTSPVPRGADPREVVRIAEAVRDACLVAARQGYESAGMSGLCHEGAMEMSLDSIRRMDVREVIAAVAAGQSR